jgi:leader peptidase (prepilin peptidase)/N-methyltransferase
MSPISVACWGLIGFVVGAGARFVTVRHQSEAAGPRGLIEIVTAVLFAAAAWRLGAHAILFAMSWLAAFAVPLAITDWRTRILPTKVILSATIGMIGLLAMVAALNHDLYPLLRGFAGLAAVLVFYGALYFFLPGQLGGGDVRLGGLLGLTLGWFSWPALLVGTLLGWLGAAIGVLVVRRVRGPDASHDLPLGPFLIAGTFLIVLLDSSL